MFFYTDKKHTTLGYQPPRSYTGDDVVATIRVDDVQKVNDFLKRWDPVAQWVGPKQKTDPKTYDEIKKLITKLREEYKQVKMKRATPEDMQYYTREISRLVKLGQKIKAEEREKARKKKKGEQGGKK